MADAFREYEVQGLDYLVYLSSDQNDEPPTAQFCLQYADQTGIDPAKMLMDPNFGTLFTNVDSGQQGGVSLPWDGVARGEGMLYEWNPSVEGDPWSKIQELLGE